MKPEKIYLFLLLFLLIVVIYLPTYLFSQQTNNTFFMSASVSTNKIPLNKSFKVTLEIKINGIITNYVLSEPFISKMHNMEIIGTASENFTVSKSNQTIFIKRYIYTLKPESLGMAYFPKVLLSVADKKGNILTQLDTQPIPVEIIEPIKKNKNSFLILYIIIFLIIGCTIFFLLTKLHKNREKDKKSEIQEEKIIIEDKYINKLDEIINENILNKEKINKLTRLLKNYLEEKYNIKIKNKSTDEILNIISNIPYNEEISILLKESDLIKYALEEPDNSTIDKFKNNIESIFIGGKSNEQRNQSSK